MTKSTEAKNGEYSIYFGWGMFILGMVILGFQLANKGGVIAIPIVIAALGVVLIVAGYLKRIAAK